MGGVRGVGAADVGHFGHHVAAAVFAPEGDADVLHAVACCSWVRRWGGGFLGVKGGGGTYGLDRRI